MQAPHTISFSGSIQATIEKNESVAKVSSDEEFTYEGSGSSIKFYGIPRSVINGQTYIGNVNIVNGQVFHTPFTGPKIKEYEFELGRLRNINLSSAASVLIEDDICDSVECNIKTSSASSLSYRNLSINQLNVKCSSASKTKFKNGNVKSLNVSTSSASRSEFENMEFKEIESYSSSASKVEFDDCTTVDITKEDDNTSKTNVKGLKVTGKMTDNSKKSASGPNIIGNNVVVNGSNITTINGVTYTSGNSFSMSNFFNNFFN